MPLESATWIYDLNSSNPDGADAKSQGDNHLRLIKSALKNHFPNPATASESSNAYTLTLSPAWTEYKEGVLLVFKAGGTNSGAATINVNSLGAIAIQSGGSALRSGAIASNDMVVGVIRDVSGTKTLQMISFNRSGTFDNAAFNLITVSSGSIILSASSSGGASFNIPHGVDPSGANNGDIWTTTTELKVRISGSNLIAANAQLSALGSTALAADKVPYATGASAWATATLTAFARTLLDDADAATVRATLAIKSMALRDVTISTSNPSGGVDGDVWLKYSP